MARESLIEDYAVKCVRLAGGEIRKARWIGRKNCPDRRVMLPGRCCWVEFKATGEFPEAAQKREHERMRKMGETVIVINSYAGVDRLVEGIRV